MLKGFKHSEETKRKMGLVRLGKKQSEEAKLKMSLKRKEYFAKGNTPWNKGKKRPEMSGEKHHFFGKHHSEVTRAKQRDAKLKNPVRYWQGKHVSEETKKRLSEINSGEKHPQWRGGISKLPYSMDWTRSLRISIRERDNYTCQVCGEKQGDKAHAIHHIDYNKLNCNSENLITLCIRCHAKTNQKREYWIDFFAQKHNLSN